MVVVFIVKTLKFPVQKTENIQKRGKQYANHQSITVKQVQRYDNKSKKLLFCQLPVYQFLLSV